MIRNARSIIPVLRALIFGSAMVSVAVAASVSVVGCADENAPETWVKKLNEPITRPAAIKRLVQFYEDAMTKANKDRNHPDVKALVDKIIEPMTNTYVQQQLDDKTRVDLIKFLADTRDARAKAAWIKGLTGFAQNKGASEDDVRWISPAAGTLKPQDAGEVADALGQAFVKLEAGTQKGSQAYKNVHDAMLALKSPSWKPMLLERINRPIPNIKTEKSDPSKVTAYQNELFWQTTAAEILGELRDASTTKPLFKAVMNPAKADVAATASMAILKIGKGAVPFLLEVLSSRDAEVVEFAKANAGGNAEEANSAVRWAAVELGAIGRRESTDAIVLALEGIGSDITRAVIARELTKLPATPASIKAFQTAYAKVSPSTLIPPGMNARSQLMEAASHFYDAALVPWLIKETKDAKGEENDKHSVQVSAMLTAIKLMKKDQLADVKAMVDKFGSSIEKDAYKQAADVVNACGETVGCYLSKMQEPASQEEKTQLLGIKSAYMLAILGGESTAMEITKQLQKVRNAAVRFSAVSAVDHLAQKDAGPVADALQKVVDENKAKDDRSMMQSDQPVKEIILRLRARG